MGLVTILLKKGNEKAKMYIQLVVRRRLAVI